MRKGWLGLRLPEPGVLFDILRIAAAAIRGGYCVYTGCAAGHDAIRRLERVSDTNLTA